MDTPQILFVELPSYGPEQTRVLVNVAHVISVHENGTDHTRIRTTHTDLTVGCGYEQVMFALGQAAGAMQP
jgi:hypothetical protein